MCVYRESGGVSGTVCVGAENENLVHTFLASSTGSTFFLKAFRKEAMLMVVIYDLLLDGLMLAAGLLAG